MGEESSLVKFSFKGGNINPVILDPYYSQSHKVTMTETGIDTRVFRTETPAVNMDDDPDNDIPYDTFEIKLNYPLPYPQIIEEVGESRERIMADSAEIEYIKKNETIINDYCQEAYIFTMRIPGVLTLHSQ